LTYWWWAHSARNM